MCVIAYAALVRPPDEMIEQMFNANMHGAGIAWRAGGLVKWKKGLKLEEILQLNASLPLPYVMHFRNPSGGTSTRPGVCHPFPLTDAVQLDLEGSINGYVLFHNGYWTNWQDHLIDYAIKSGKRLPGDSWSDSRGLAWVAHHWGLGVLELLGQKVVVFGPAKDDIEFFQPSTNGWEKVMVGESYFWASNTWWDHDTKKRDWSRLPAHYQEQQHGQHGGAAHGKPFRGTDQPDAEKEGGPHQQEAVQQGHEANREDGGEAQGETPLETLRWVRSLNPSSTKPPIPITTPIRTDRGCRICGSWQVFDRPTRLCYGCWIKEKGYEHKPVVKTDLSLYTCRKCYKTFNIGDVHYMGLDGTNREIWHCYVCSPMAGVALTASQINGTSNLAASERQKRQIMQEDGKEIVGPLA